MTKSIQSYQDLVEEKQRLEILLLQQKQILHNDIQEIKQELSLSLLPFHLQENGDKG
ncbi:MAG: hypothetical protein WDO16_21840 [Bacteroidota bacterium]